MIETLLGFLTFTGSLMAMGKLQEILPQRPITYQDQNVSTSLLFAIARGAGRAAGDGPHRHVPVSRSSLAWRCCSACC